MQFKHKISIGNPDNWSRENYKGARINHSPTNNSSGWFSNQKKEDQMETNY
jgi:hypothetical protein